VTELESLQLLEVGTKETVRNGNETVKLNVHETIYDKKSLVYSSDFFVKLDIRCFLVILA